MSLPLLEQMKLSLSPQLAGYAAKTLGETPANTERAIDAALPAILSGVASASQMPSGLASVARLVRDPINDGTLLTQLPALYQGTMTAAPVYRLGSQLLHAIFGNKLGQMTQSIAALGGVKPGSSALLISMLAPHVLSVLGKRQRAAADTTPAGLARLMQKEQASIASALPPVIGEVFGAPAVAAAAATAATGVASTAKPVVAAIKTAKKVDARPSAAARRASTVTEADAREAQTRGMGPWAILPVGLILGAGLLGIGLLKSSEPAPDRVAVAPAPPAPVAAVPPVAPKAAEPVPAAKAVEAKPATPAPKVAEAKPAGAKPTPTPRAAEPKPAAAAPPPPPGTTTFFGQTPAIAEMPAKPNPDYKPAAVASAIAAIPPAPPPPAPPTAVAAPMPMTPPGVTSYFGPGKPVIEMAAVLNPDYKPAAPPAPSVVEPVVPPAPVVPGVTSFYGVTPSPPDAPAKLNPDYKPAAPVVAAAPPTPVAPPVVRAPGVTSYFGTSPAPAEAPARPNPDYKPSQVAAAAPVAPAPAPTAPAAPIAGPSLAACQTTVTAAVKSGPVLFKNALATLRPGSIATLDRIAAAFKGCPGARLRVEGHTDNNGAAEMNLTLSQARARTVADYLASKGIEAGKLSPAGFGLTRPAVPNTSSVNRALNRRIEFIVDKP